MQDAGLPTSRTASDRPSDAQLSALSEEIKGYSEYQFAEFFTHFLEKIKEDPVTNFIRHPLFCDFQPTPAQTVALKTVLGQHLDPVADHSVWKEVQGLEDDFGLEKVLMNEVQIYEMMTGTTYDYDLVKVRNRINMVVGRRGGKTSLSAILAGYGCIKTNWRPYLSKTPYATVAILSTSTELSEEILDILRDIIESSPILSRLIDKRRKNTQKTFNLKVPFLVNGTIEYSRVQIKVGAASKKTIRGRAICVLLCDEIAFWGTEENAAERDEDILRAARPSLLQFKDQGLMIKLSSPGIKQGVLYNEYLRRDELPDSYVVFKAPSWVWNTILDEAAFKEEYLVDPVGFGVEYRADFADSISTFILPELLDACTLRGVQFQSPEDKKTDVVYAAAIDAAFKGDRFTFSIAGHLAGRVKQYIMKDWKGSRKQPVRANEVAAYIRTVCSQYGISRVYADQYSYQPLKEIFEQYGIDLQERTFTNKFKRQIYFNLKKLVHNHQIDLLDHYQMNLEIKQLQVEQTGTGNIRIGHPPGGHDDCADALAIASFIATEAIGVGNSDLAEIAGDDHQIPTDVSGRAFVAPSPSMLSPIYGNEIIDNSKDWIIDPETGLLKRADEDDPDDEGDSQDGGSGMVMG